jgi:hypothetical protein
MIKNLYSQIDVCHVLMFIHDDQLKFKVKLM